MEEANLLLKGMGYAPIYPRLKRDAIISHGLLHRTPLVQNPAAGYNMLAA